MPKEQDFSVQFHTLGERLASLQIAAVNILKRLNENKVHIDYTMLISFSRPQTLDYKNRSNVYMKCLNSNILQFGDYGNVIFPPDEWQNVPFPEGTQIKSLVVGTDALFFVRATNSEVR